MTAKNSAYWRQRFEELEKQLNAYGLEAYSGIEPAFNEALRDIDNQIEKWIYRIAENNEISMTAARKLLDKNQLEEFRWSVDEYIRYGKENAMNQQWIKQLENASAKVHISRLEALKLQTQQAMEMAYGNYLDGIDDMARRVYSEGYYRTVFAVQHGIGIGWGIASIDENKLSKLISRPWAADGKNFSDRIWIAKAQMVGELHQELTKACILGHPPDETIKKLAQYVNKKFKNAKVQAGRLVMTEQAFFGAASQKDAFNDLGVKEYEIVATLDSHTSETCRELDGKHFPMSQYEPGVAAPPFHVWCRSTTCPYFDDEFTIGETRAARGEDGKTYYVPADMSYREWQVKYAKDANAVNTASSSDKEMYGRYKDVLKELSPESVEDFVNIKYNNNEQWERLKYKYRTVNRYDVEGNVPVDKIIQLDNVAYYTKKTGFDYSTLTGKQKKKVRISISNSGNAAAMELDGQLYFSHSKLGEIGSLEYSLYSGDYPAVTIMKNRIFSVKDLGDGVLREYDTEAKFLEFIATIKHPSDKFTVTILSEKHICESCQGVVEQFKQMFPNATVNIISGRKGYNGSDDGLKTWKYRKKVK